MKLKSTEYHGDVKDLQVDFKDGLALIALLDALTSAGKLEITLRVLK